MFKLTRRASVSCFIVVVIAIGTASYSAYRGHADDSDINAVLAAYPNLKGAEIDSCATCHKSGKVAGSSGSLHQENHCGYCHATHVNNKISAKETLNRYGEDYLAAGRGIKAVRAVAGKDSDGDGFSNESEFLKGTNPGEMQSNPSAPIAPNKIFASNELRTLSPTVSETVFLNTSRNKQGDFYNEYRGNRAHELLKAVGISEAADSVDFISLDGFEGSFTLKELKTEWPQGKPVLGLDKKTIGPCGWVNYNVRDLDEKTTLPWAQLMLAFEENGRKIESGRLDTATGRIVGTGPLRLVVPQFTISPPDLPQYADQSCKDRMPNEFHFNEGYDHNGGKSSFSIIAVRVNPLPKGTRDFSWQKIRNELISGEKIVFFGALGSSSKEKTDLSKGSPVVVQAISVGCR
jgi:hypothetical protein